MIGWTITQISLVTVNIYCFCYIYKHLQVHNSLITCWNELQTYFFWKQFVFFFLESTYYDVLHMYLNIWCDIIHMYLRIHTNVSTYIHNVQHMYGLYEMYHLIAQHSLISLVFLSICCFCSLHPLHNSTHFFAHLIIFSLLLCYPLLLSLYLASLSVAYQKKPYPPVRKPCTWSFGKQQTFDSQT